jgi:carbamoyltransferase
MVILGLSGSVNWDVKETKWIHGSGFTVIIDGHLVLSTAQERFSRVKYDGNFSKETLDYIFKRLNLSYHDIDIVCAPNYCHSPGFGDNFSNLFPNSKIYTIDHHLCHNSAAFLTSPFCDEDVNIVSFDNTGAIDSLGAIYSSFYIGNNKKHQLINVNNEYNCNNDIDHYCSMGEFYLSYSAYSYYKKTNIVFNGIAQDPIMTEWLPGKIMGLSGFGNFNDNFILPMEVVTMEGNPYSMPHIVPIRSYYDEGNHANILSQSSEDIAAWCQHNFEKILLEYFSKIPKSIKKNKLCFSGGCALNILLNSKIIDLGIYDDVHIPTAPNDDGLHQGAALIKAWELEKEIILPTNLGCIGLDYSDTNVKTAINNANLTKHIVKELEFNEVVDRTAHFLKDNKIIGWYQGKSEFGPRALGNRSILANPMYNNKDYLNNKVKFREYWRPYAAIVLEEHLDEWFKIGKKDSYYMLFNSSVREDKKHKIPAVTHVDGTCRIQVVNQNQNLKLFELLTRFFEITGVPVLLNTSFNIIKGEPIVETPADALKSFLNSRLDSLILHNNFIEPI